MSRARLCVASLLLTACGGPSGSGLSVLVEYHATSVADACVKLSASPQTPAGLTKGNGFALAGKPKDGTARFGVAIGETWQGDVTVTATLHRPCADAAIAADSKSVKAPAQGSVVRLDLVLSEQPASGDGGFGDAGERDAGLADAGTDGGSGDAGPRGCDGGITYFAGPSPMGSTWRDVALYPPDGVWLAGAGGLHFKSATGWVAASLSCTGFHAAAWARPDGRVYYGTLGLGLRSLDPIAGAGCVNLPTSSGAGEVLGIAGFVDGGTVLYSVTRSGTILRQTDPDFPPGNRRWDLGDAGVGVLWTIAGPDESALYAGGQSSNGNTGLIYRFDPLTDGWVKQTIAAADAVNDVSVVDGALAFAGTEGKDLFVWDGGTWTKVSNNSFGDAIYGLQAFSATQVYAVGNNATVRRWDGAAWATLGAFDAGQGADTYLARIRGRSACDLWSAGTAGLVITTP